MNFNNFQKVLTKLFDDVPFHKLLGMKIISFTDDGLVVEFNNVPELIGNQVKQILHGGVIAAVIDAVGGFAGAVRAYRYMEGLPENELEKKLNKFSTTDIHVEFLKPGKAPYFEATGYTIKAGKKRIASRVEIRNDQGDLLATGTGNYLY